MDWRFNRQNRAFNQEHDDSLASGNSYLIDEKHASPLAIIYRSELDYISRCVLDYPNIETGGQLFGFWTSQGAPVVLYAIGPGQNANHQPTFFNQDSNYLITVGNALLEKYALQHIGEWHSHHQLGLARPSGHDAQTMFHGLAKIPQRRLLLCICNYDRGRSVINPFTFHENDMHDYVDASWRVKEMVSPFRPLADRDLYNILRHPMTAHPSLGTLRLIDKVSNSGGESGRNIIRFSDDYWLMTPENIELLKQMLAFVQKQYSEKKVSVQSSSDGIVQITINDGQRAFRFPAHFPQQAPELLDEGEIIAAPQWYCPDDMRLLPYSFQRWVRDIDNKS